MWLPIIAAVIHILFLGTRWCIAAQQLDCVELVACDGNSCQITPGNFWCLQEMIGSDKILVLDGEKFTIDWENDFVSIESVSNLTITGRESSTLVQCSPLSSFGFYIGDSTDITFTKLRFENCNAHAVFEVTICNVTLCPPDCVESVTVTSTFYVEESSNVILLNVDIWNSPAFAVTASNILSVTSNGQEDSNKFDLILKNCTISDSQQGSIMLNRTRSLLIDTLIRNSSVGIMSEWTELKLEKAVVMQHTASILRNGNLTVNGSLRMSQSSLNIAKQTLFIKNSEVAFTESPDSYTGFMASASTLFIEGNSTVVFAKYILTEPFSALTLVGSNLVMRDNSTLMVTTFWLWSVP